MRERVLLGLAVVVAVLGVVVAGAAPDGEPRLVQATNSGDPDPGSSSTTSPAATTTPKPADAAIGETTTTAAPPEPADGSPDPVATPSTPGSTTAVATTSPDVPQAAADVPTVPVDTTPPPTTAPPPETATSPGVYAVDPVTGSSRRVVPPGFAVQDVSPRGDRFLLGPGFGQQGWSVVDLDGARTPVPIEPVSGSFSPDGRRLAYLAGRGTIAVWDSDRPSEPSRIVLEAGYTPEIEWSPTEDLLLFTSNQGTEVVHVDGTGRRRVSADPFGHFSPDGSRVLIDRRGMDTGILEVFDLQGNLVADLSRERRRDQTTDVPTWSPDGRSIGYVLESADGTSPCVVDLATGSHACGAGPVRFYLGWTPSNELLVPIQASADGYSTELHVVDPVRGSDRVLLPAIGGRVYHFFMPYGRTVLATGEVLVSVLAAPGF